MRLVSIVLSIGKYASGAGAIESDIAIGDYARANITIGNKVEEINILSLEASLVEVKNIIKRQYLNLRDCFIRVANFFIILCLIYRLIKI